MSKTGHPSSIRQWPGRILIGLRLLGRFGAEMLVSNLAQARLILSPSMEIHPHWINYRTCLRTPWARNLLGALVSMTPGTLTCDLEENTLRIHVLGIDSDPDVANHIREKFESLLEKMEGEP